MLEIKRRDLVKPFSVTFFLFVMFYYYQSDSIIKFNLIRNETTEPIVLLDNDHQPVDTEYADSKNMKTILLWNSPHRIEVAAFGTGNQPFINNGCSITNCYIQANSSEFWIRATANDSQVLKSFDAVLVNIHELWLSFLPKYERPAGQRLVWLTQESPQTTTGFVDLSSNKFNRLFNWTMTYKRDSDIQLLYGRFMRIENQTRDVKEVRREKMAVLSEKSNNTAVAWMVSHCTTNSRREDYVRLLQEHIQVDVYGGCGNMSCQRNGIHWISNPECYEMIGRKYKFYLSFENSFCNDYVTEKFFSILQLDVVPVVFGAADYRSIAPIHSYIDALAFNSPAKLAEYLILLNGNDELYMDYLEWKSSYRVEAGVEQMARHAFCALCAKLNQDDEPQKVYDSMVPYWSSSTQCRSGWSAQQPASA